MTPEQRKSLDDYQAIIDEFRNGKPALYNEQGVLIPETLGDSAMGGIETDPRYREAELAALLELEQQSRDGFTAQDRADQARTEMDVNRAHRGRVGAIQQSMATRGAGGTGLELVAQMQSAQDANELAALQALEREGMAGDRRRQATMDRGALASQLQGRDFGQQSQQAQAADRIKAFNAQVANSAQAANLQNRQNVANLNTGTANDRQTAAMQAGLGGAQMGYNAATEDENRRLLEKQERERRELERRKAMGQAVGGVVGGVAGAFGGPATAAAGASAGSSIGGAFGSMYPSDERVKKDVRPEQDGNVEAFLATLAPKSYSYEGEDKPRHGVLAQDLEKSLIGRDMIATDENGVKNISVPDAISGLLAAVAHLNRKIRG